MNSDPIEQAVFTSAQTSRGDGYQVVAASPGMTEADRRALAAWGPSEGAIADPAPDARSINFHPLPSGNHCISLTMAAGSEYSGRGGMRFFTQCFAVPPGVLARFANNPFALMAAVVSGGRLYVDALPDALESFSLVGRADAVDTLLLSDLSLHPGAAWMATLVQAALESTTLAIAGPLSPEKIIAGLLNCLPPPSRTEYPFSTGLICSSRLALPDHRAAE